MGTSTRITPALLWIVMDLLAFALTGCGAGHRTRVAHPATSGALAEALVVRSDRFAAQGLNLDPHALDDEIRLVRLDGEAACFDVLMRGLGEEAQTSTALTFGFGGRRRSEEQAIDLTRARDDVFLVTSSGARLAPTNVIARPMEQAVTEGTAYVEQDTGRTAIQCVEESDNGSCLRYEEQAVTETVGVAVDHRLLVQRAIVCFAHGGQVTPQESAVDLLIGRAHFGFDLTSPAPAGAAGPSTPIVAPGYEFLLASARRTTGGPTEVTHAADAIELPPGLARIPLKAMRLTHEDGRALLVVEESGALTIQGVAGRGRIEDGVVRSRSGQPVLALTQDGGVYVLDLSERRMTLAARVSDDRLVNEAGNAIWVDGSGRPLRQRAGGRRERGDARISPRLRPGDDRVLAALLVLMAEREIRWH